MASEEEFVVRGTVVMMSRGDFLVRLHDTGETVKCKLSGKMRKFRIRIVMADEVDVELSPYDPQRGRIVYRVSSGRKQ